MTEPRWLSADEVLWLHALQISEFGGIAGVRDLNLLESALARVRQRFYYGELSTLQELAVAYAVAINANHPFLDGNKRVGFHCMLVFLRMHQLVLRADTLEASQIMLDLAAGRISEAEIHEWLLTRVNPV